MLWNELKAFVGIFPLCYIKQKPDQVVIKILQRNFLQVKVRSRNMDFKHSFDSVLDNQYL